MKVSIEVKDKKEAAAIRRAMSDPTTRALVVVVGLVLELPTDRARRRALWSAKDYLEEQNELVGDSR